ncbi:UNVERIFIED_CONTAM: Pectinesterase inhibitor 9 [Sesamum radiatum]|uniref:Pectinesterase inhibitor 9 n=1 Tax=Sesamum radiatum TaxID=300843 RepID=A0AAW2KU01_SESRA
MALKINLPFFLLSLLVLTLVRAEHPVVRRRSRARAFIELQCRTTLYPDLCVRCLSYYVSNFTTTLSHQQLAQIALKVSLERAESTQAYVTEVAMELKQRKAKDYRAVKECLDQINDGVDQLTNCIKETRMIKETTTFPWHASNVQTWMSTALTDASMCMDGFERAIEGIYLSLILNRQLAMPWPCSIGLLRGIGPPMSINPKYRGFWAICIWT